MDIDLRKFETQGTSMSGLAEVLEVLANLNLKEKLFSLRASRLGPCRRGGLVALRLRELNLDSLKNEVCRFRVFQFQTSLEVL